jgi:AraC-like DNA-binding protein
MPKYEIKGEEPHAGSGQELRLPVDTIPAATIAYLSKYHFARAFRRAVGQSPHRYLSVKRLGRAKALLIQSDRSLLDIALVLKFFSQGSFTRAFGRATGQKPGQYRPRIAKFKQRYCRLDHPESKFSQRFAGAR